MANDQKYESEGKRAIEDQEQEIDHRSSHTQGCSWNGLDFLWQSGEPAGVSSIYGLIHFFFSFARSGDNLDAFFGIGKWRGSIPECKMRSLVRPSHIDLPEHCPCR